MLYTRRGDKGRTGLFGTDERLPKDSLLYDALGTIDELNSLLGICRAQTGSDKKGTAIQRMIQAVQECLFIIQAEIAGADKSIKQAHIDQMEQHIEQIEKLIHKPHSFVIPGATPLSALYDYARAVARRAERTVWGMQSQRTIAPESAAYLNRLSSFLYALARFFAADGDARETSPTY